MVAVFLIEFPSYLLLKKMHFRKIKIRVDEGIKEISSQLFNLWIDVLLLYLDVATDLPVLLQSDARSRLE